MSTAIFYYTGTGNSLWVARTMAKSLGDAELIPLSSIKDPAIFKNKKIETIGLVFPVYMWGVPAPVIHFVKSVLTDIAADYLFAIAVNAGEVANTLMQLKSILRNQNLSLSVGLDIVMPSNYTPMGGPGSTEKQQKLFENASKKIAKNAETILAQKKMPLEKGPFWQRRLYSKILYPIVFPKIPGMDKKFFADDKCNKCGTCEKVCPAKNITLIEDKPVWNHHCEQCFACLQWCPQKAIQYGKKTSKIERYHHPEVNLKDILPLR